MVACVCSVKASCPGACFSLADPISRGRLARIALRVVNCVMSRRSELLGGELRVLVGRDAEIAAGRTLVR
jgi:hypothetical protein